MATRRDETDWKKVNQDYDEERAWDYFRDNYNIDVSNFATPEALEEYLRSLFGQQPLSGAEGRGGYGSFGEEGISKVVGVALDEWEGKAPVPLHPTPKVERAPPKPKVEVEKGVEPEEVPLLEEITEEEIGGPPAKRVRGKRERKVKLEPVPTMVIPEVKAVERIVPEVGKVYKPEEIRLEEVETPSGKMTRVVETIKRGVATSTGAGMAQQPRNVAERIRDTVADVVQGIADRIRQLGR